ncbi:hypothetical protein GGF31_000836 [Allomyces arbusculus]|nr:hypothetical protein GGF31_000836 [Allomyces arbusculus]
MAKTDIATTSAITDLLPPWLVAAVEDVVDYSRPWLAVFQGMAPTNLLPTVVALIAGTAILVLLVRQAWRVTRPPSSICFYCNQTVVLMTPGDTPRHFTCPYCTATNLFDDRGEFVPQAAWTREELNPPATTYRGDSLEPRTTAIPAATGAESVLCDGCLHNHRINLRSQLARDETNAARPLPLDFVCEDCEPALRAYWQRHYAWYLHMMRPGKHVPVPSLPHTRPMTAEAGVVACVRYAVGESVGFVAWAVFAGLWALASIGWYQLSIPTDRSSVHWDHLALLALVVLEASYNPLMSAFWQYKRDPNRKFYHRLFSRSLRRFRVVWTAPVLAVRCAQIWALTHPETLTLWWWIGAGVLPFLVKRLLETWRQRALLSYGLDFCRGPPIGHLSLADVRNRLDLDPNAVLADDDDPHHDSDDALSPDDRLRQYRSAPVVSDMTPSSANALTETVLDRLDDWHLKSPHAATSSSPLGRGTPLNAMFAHVPTLQPHQIPRPQPFGHGNLFQARMDIDPTRVNQTTVPRSFAARMPGTAITRTAWDATLQDQARQVQTRREQELARAEAEREQARIAALRPSAAVPRFALPLQFGDDGSDSSDSESAFTGFGPPPPPPAPVGDDAMDVDEVPPTAPAPVANGDSFWAKLKRASGIRDPAAQHEQNGRTHPHHRHHGPRADGTGASANGGGRFAPRPAVGFPLAQAKTGVESALDTLFL